MKTIKCRCGHPLRPTHTEATANLFYKDEQTIIQHYYCDHCQTHHQKKQHIDTSQQPLWITLKTDFE